MRVKLSFNKNIIIKTTLLLIGINGYAADCIITSPLDDKGKVLYLENYKSYIVIENKYKVYLKGSYIEQYRECSIYKNKAYSYDICNEDNKFYTIKIIDIYGGKQVAHCYNEFFFTAN